MARTPRKRLGRSLKPVRVPGERLGRRLGRRLMAAQAPQVRFIRAEAASPPKMFGRRLAKTKTKHTRVIVLRGGCGVFGTLVVDPGGY